jgi:hypothetical protein
VVFEILGLQGFVYLLPVLGFMVICHVLKNVEAKKEEVITLVQDKILLSWLK